MEYWSLEQAKLNKVKELQGKVVAITGGLGKIGFETCKLFKDKGAEVVILDVGLNLYMNSESNMMIYVLSVMCQINLPYLNLLVR